LQGKHIRLDDRLISIIGIFSDDLNINFSSALRIVIANGILSNNKIKKDKQMINYLNLIIYDLTRKNSRRETELKSLLSNLKQKCLKQILNGNSPKNIYEIFLSGFERIKNLVSHEDYKSAKKIKLKTIINVKNKVDEMIIKGISSVIIKKSGFDRIIEVNTTKFIEDMTKKEAELRNKEGKY